MTAAATWSLSLDRCASGDPEFVGGVLVDRGPLKPVFVEAPHLIGQHRAEALELGGRGDDGRAEAVELVQGRLRGLLDVQARA
ncbi:hypothetical protein [Saccharopolyspora sp. NPDC050642]|uniref:hypothetical protein n=1 Tax=Saccharopolyspora sp. NPDC050642 TaxID=3157099 RepID=UPI00340E4DBA